MSMKKTDIEKHLAKKIDGRMKSGIVPQRFGQGSAAPAAEVPLKSRAVAPKLVPISCRLPIELVNRLREQAIAIDGGMNAVMTQAVEHWLNSIAGKVSASVA